MKTALLLRAFCWARDSVLVMLGYWCSTGGAGMEEVGTTAGVITVASTGFGCSVGISGISWSGLIGLDYLMSSIVSICLISSKQLVSSSSTIVFSSPLTEVSWLLTDSSIIGAASTRSSLTSSLSYSTAILSCKTSFFTAEKVSFDYWEGDFVMLAGYCSPIFARLVGVVELT